MTETEMADLIAEVLAVDTEEQSFGNVVADDNVVKFENKNQEQFIITITK